MSATLDIHSTLYEIQQCIEDAMFDMLQSNQSADFCIIVDGSIWARSVSMLSSKCYAKCASIALTVKQKVDCYFYDKNTNSLAARPVFTATPKELILSGTTIATFIDTLWDNRNKVHYMGCAELMTHEELTKEANYFLPAASKYKNEPYDMRRLEGSHCVCKPNEGDFDLLPINSPVVQEGQKRYIVCRKCGCMSHL